MREAAVAKIREKALKKLAKRVENAKASSSRKDWGCCAERILWVHHGHCYFRWSLRSSRFQFWRKSLWNSKSFLKARPMSLSPPWPSCLTGYWRKNLRQPSSPFPPKRP